MSEKSLGTQKALPFIWIAFIEGNYLVPVAMEDILSGTD
jgi:hypothetical protein